MHNWQMHKREQSSGVISRREGLVVNREIREETVLNLAAKVDVSCSKPGNPSSTPQKQRPGVFVDYWA